ncbi:uncharacterized protein LOC109123905 [Vitis vinifera]|uniref:Uncharacterized protein n=1 Tax=Vitis vinifera TaxID=29760 RepID=A0A438D815_VITVI|nr:uncharacterized protein LOC109123905 [Vitis vinifera]RVW31599.1 hypothetical protein CK203_091113 [Vitis vinifera]|eukprot:XP_019080521.1 PREDICTED: uncharacterized protein LOC109123905 [Vitis vinifera]
MYGKRRRERRSEIEAGLSYFPLYFGQLEQLQEQNLQQRWQQQKQQSTIDYRRLTSFLEYDDSFLSVWNWKPTDTSDNGSSSQGAESRRLYIELQSGSLFSRDVFYVKSEYMKSKQPFEKAFKSHGD